MSSSDEEEQQPQGSSDQWAPSGRSSEDDDGGQERGAYAPQVNNLGLQHAGGAPQQQQEAETRTQPNHNEQLMRMLASYGGTADAGGLINAGGLLRSAGEQGESMPLNIYNTNETSNMGTARLAGPPSGSRIDILSAVGPGNMPTTTAAAAPPNEQDDHQQQRPSKRARIKKPDSGYSIFFRTQRQLLEDTGESVEHAYEREVAPLSTLDNERNRSKALVKLVAARWKRLGRLERMKYDIIAEEQRIQSQHDQQEQGEEGEQQEQQQQSHQPQRPLHSTTFLPTSAEQTAAGNPPHPANMVVPIIQMILTAQRLPSLTPALIVALAQVPESSLEQASLILKIILDTKKNMEAARTTQQTLQWLVTSILHPHGSGSNIHQTPVPAAVAAPVFAPPRHNNTTIQPWPPPTNVAAAGDLARILAEQMMTRGATTRTTTATTTSQGNRSNSGGSNMHHLPATTAAAAPSHEASSVVGSASHPRRHHHHHHHHHHRQEGGGAADHVGMAAPSTAAGFPTTNTTTGAPQPPAGPQHPQPLPLLPPLAATWQSSSSAQPPPPNTATPPEGCCIS